jgi:DNA-binding NarL/FixJ family response regulator
VSEVLIGRERELRVLVEAAAGPPAMVLIEGEAGIGKSRLVREAVARAAVGSGRVLTGNCHRLREPFLLGPVVEALRGTHAAPPRRPLSPVAGALRPLLPELADILPAEPGRIHDAKAERHRIFRALRELIVALGPTLCVLEDVHWADEGTLEFLAFLMAEPPPQLSLAMTYRSEDLPPSASLLGAGACLPGEVFQSRIELAPLSLEEVGSLVRALLGDGSVPPELTAYLHDQTAGIPFAVEEMVGLLRDSGQLESVEQWQAATTMRRIGVPRVVQLSIRQRMAGFSADALLVSRVAAVIAERASEDFIGSVAELSPARTAKAITQALRAAVLEESGHGSYAFRHALAAQAVYDDIPGPERRRLHKRAAEALESEPAPRPLEQLAHHYHEADRPRESARYAEAAADAASAAGDDRAAARLLEHALSMPGLSRAARVRLALKLAPAALYSLEPESSIAPLQRILDDEHMAVGARGQLRYWISRLRCQTGDPGPWREAMMQAAEELRRRPQLAARAMINLAWPVYTPDSVEGDLAWLDRATEAARSTDDPIARIAVHSQRAAILLSVGDPAGWEAIDDIPPEGSSIEEKLQLLRGYHGLSVAAMGLGYHDRAADFLDEVARLDDELDHVSWAPWRESTLISLDWRTGRWDGLKSRIDELSRRLAGRLGLAVSNQLVLGSLLLALDRLDEAEGVFTSVLEKAESRHWMTSRITARAGLAEILLAREDAPAAWSTVVPALDLIRRKGIWIWGRQIVPVAVQAQLARGEPAAARELVDEFSDGIEGRDAPAAHAASKICRASLAEAEGSHLAACELLEEAERAFAELPVPLEAARAREGRARCMLAGGDSAGEDLLLDALSRLEDLGATRDLALARAELKANDIALPSQGRGGRRAYGNELSPREEEVAELAGMGRKNREIAEMLFISQRTVETHVASALRKLGALGREELAPALAARRGDESSVLTAKNR